MNFLTQIFNITSSRHQNTSKPSMTGIAHMRAALPKVEKEIRTYKNPSSISLDIDKHKNIVIVIYYYHQAGFGIDIGDFIEMNYPYTFEDIGRNIVECFETRSQRPVVTEEERACLQPSFKVITKGKGFVYWLNRHECIHVHMGENISIEYMHRESSGENRGYSQHKEEYNEIEIKLSKDSSAMQIGQAVNQVYRAKNGVDLAAVTKG